MDDNVTDAGGGKSNEPQESMVKITGSVPCLTLNVEVSQYLEVALKSARIHEVLRTLDVLKSTDLLPEIRSTFANRIRERPLLRDIERFRQNIKLSDNLRWKRIALVKEPGVEITMELCPRPGPLTLRMNGWVTLSSIAAAAILTDVLAYNRWLPASVDDVKLHDLTSNYIKWSSTVLSPVSRIVWDRDLEIEMKAFAMGQPVDLYKRLRALAKSETCSTDDRRAAKKIYRRLLDSEGVRGLLLIAESPDTTKLDLKKVDIPGHRARRLVASKVSIYPHKESTVRAKILTSIADIRIEDVKAGKQCVKFSFLFSVDPDLPRPPSWLFAFVGKKILRNAVNQLIERTADVEKFLVDGSADSENAKYYGEQVKKALIGEGNPMLVWVVTELRRQGLKLP